MEIVKIEEEDLGFFVKVEQSLSYEIGQAYIVISPASSELDHYSFNFAGVNFRYLSAYTTFNCSYMETESDFFDHENQQIGKFIMDNHHDHVLQILKKYK